MKKITIFATLIITGFVGVLSLTTVTSAVDIYDACNGASSSLCKDKTADIKAAGGPVATIIDTLLLIVGILAVIMLIYGGFLYATSAGDPSKLSAAKNTVLYSIVGLVVAVLAFAIVKLISTSF